VGEQEGVLKAYSMPCHGIFLIYSFTTWILLSDVAKHSITSWNIMCHDKIFFDKPWNILPHHIHGLFRDEQWFIDSKHGFSQESR
jgi:hypothetical protein